MANPVPVEIMVDVALDKSLTRGETLIGIRLENQYMAEHIKNNYSKIGVGLCQTKKKFVDIYSDDNGNIYGVSTVLPYRYFELNHSWR